MEIVTAIVLVAESVVKKIVNKLKIKVANVCRIRKQAFDKTAFVHSSGARLTDVMI